MLRPYKRGTPLPEHLESLYRRFNPTEKQVAAGNNPWTDVMVDDDPDAQILATGFDVAGRKQRIYSSTHNASQKDVKFDRVRNLLSQWEDVRTQIEADLNRKNLDEKVRECALLAMLIYETGIRPGSNTDTLAQVKAYGATTLLLKHVKPCPRGVRLQFIGKKGVKQNVLVTNPYLVRVFVKRKRATTSYTTPLFEYGVGALRDYFKQLGSGEFTPKDFRTAVGTSLALEILGARKRIPKTKSARRAVVNAALDKVCAKLGNTRGIAKHSYVAPEIIERFMPSET